LHGFAGVCALVLYFPLRMAELLVGSGTRKPQGSSGSSLRNDSNMQKKTLSWRHSGDLTGKEAFVLLVQSPFSLYHHERTVAFE